MPSYVVFNGVTKYTPGGLSRITTDVLAPVAPGINSVVAIIGEAEGGVPGEIVRVDNSNRIRELFWSGPMADAINIAFAPSGDPRIPAGASTCLCYKTNNSTQATLTLPGGAASAEVDSTAIGGTLTTLVDSSLIGTTNTGEFNNMWLVLKANTPEQEIRRVISYDATTGTFTVDANWQVLPASGDTYQVLSNTVPFVGKVGAGGDTTTVVVDGATFEENEHAGRWVKIFPAIGPDIMRQIVSNTETELVVSPAMSAPPASDSWLQVLAKSVVLTSRDYGAHTNGVTVDMATAMSGAKITTVSFDNKDHVSGEIGNFSFLKVLFKGGEVVASDAVAEDSTTSVIQVASGSLVASAHAGHQVLIDGEYTTVVSNTASALTVYPAFSSVPTVGEYIEIRSTTNATAFISGSKGQATGFSTFTGVPTVDLNITFPANYTLRQFINEINLNVNYLAVVPDGINPDTTLMKDFDFGDSTRTDITVSPTLTSKGFKQNASQLVNYYNEVSSIVTASRASDGDYDGALTAGDTDMAIPMSGGTRGTSSNASFQAGFDTLLTIRANHVVPLIDKDLIHEGFGSTATVASVAAQLKDHVIAARGAVGSERGGYIGFDGTFGQIIAQANAMNDMDIMLTCQRPTFLNLSGTLQEFGPRMLAVAAAGCRAGVTEIGEPLTNKTINTASLTNDNTWEPSDLTDANELVKAGVLFGFTDDTNIIRWVRDLTTYISTNDLAYSEGSIRDTCRFIAYNLRKAVVDRYVGRKAAPATIRNIKNTVVLYMEQARQNGLIVDSTDPATLVTTYAYHSLKVTASGDTVKICLGFFPVPGINFLLFDLSIGVATQIA